MCAPKIDQLDASLWPLSTLGSRKHEFVTHVAPLLHAFNRPGVSIAFGGHFNSGKSTLLAALIGRDVLPIGDVPETGVACMLRAGGVDQVRRIARSGEASGIAFDKKTIAGVIAAYTHLGERRTLDDMPESLEIEIANSPIPPRATWIDSPGINDTLEMSDRAFQVALDADLLVWVLNSRQCLSDPEIQFLREFVLKRGTEALAFVLNVFLDDDNTDTWARFSARELPVLLRRVRDHAEEFGAEGERLTIHAVSARALRGAIPTDFGGAELKRWLSSFKYPTNRIVRASRLRRAEIACAEYSRLLEPEIERANTNALKSKDEVATHDKKLKQRAAFRTAAASIVADSLLRFSDTASNKAEELIVNLVSGDLKRGTYYEDTINKALSEASLGEEINDRLSIEFGKHNLGAVSQRSRDLIARAVALEALSIVVPKTVPSNDAMGAGALVAGIGAAVMTGGLSLLAVAAGALVGRGIASSNANAEDLAITKQRIGEAIDTEVERIISQERALLLIIDKAWLGTAPKPPVQDNLSNLEELSALQNEYNLFVSRLHEVTKMNLD
jgi:hypothetical protein